jgi:hypothetical protein
LEHKLNFNEEILNNSFRWLIKKRINQYMKYLDMKKEEMKKISKDIKSTSKGKI